MLQSNVTNFFRYCKIYHFSDSALEAFSTRLKEFDAFLTEHRIESIDQISYQHLIEFVASGNPSNHVKKVRVWTMRQFFHYLKFKKIIQRNIAKKLPYPKIEKSEPKFLSLEELKVILTFFLHQADSLFGLRNLVMIMMLSFLGIRLSALRNLNLSDVHLDESILWIREKGYVRRPVPLPQILCIFLYRYLKKLDKNSGPLFLSKRRKRISRRAVQYVFDLAEKNITIDKHLHCHLFRHTAATQLNQTSGVDVTQFVMGHRSRRTTERYIHLDSERYAEYMRRHPYHSFREAGHE